jgi:integrase
VAKGIYKQNGSELYWIRYAGPDGKIIRESTKTANFKEAQAKLENQRKAIRDGKEPEPIKKVPIFTFAQLAIEYTAWCERQRSIRSKKGFIFQLVDKFGNIQLRHFNTKMLEQFQSERLLKGNRQVKQGDEWVFLPNKPATINRLMATIKHMFHKGYQWEMCGEETLKRVRQVKLLEENNRRLRYLSREECAELVSKCKDVTGKIVMAALNTGMRKGEILSLKWENVDMKHGFVLLDRTKNGERREIPINEDFKAVLQSLTRQLDVPYVFFDTMTGKPYQDVKRSFSTACRQAGIHDFHFHDLRHTFASHLIMAGADITTVSKLLGHKSLTMTLRYSHLAPDHLQKAVNMLNFTGEERRTAYLLHSQAGNQ